MYSFAGATAEGSNEQSKSHVENQRKRSQRSNDIDNPYVRGENSINTEIAIATIPPNTALTEKADKENRDIMERKRIVNKRIPK